MAVSDVKNNARISPTVNVKWTREWLGRASGLDNCKSNPIIEIGLYRRMTRGICRFGGMADAPVLEAGVQVAHGFESLSRHHRGVNTEFVSFNYY